MSEKITIEDLHFAANILENYIDKDDAEEFAESFESLQRIVAFVDAEIARREKRVAVNNAKRDYAAKHGISFREVRYSSKASA